VSLHYLVKYRCEIDHLKDDDEAESSAELQPVIGSVMVRRVRLRTVPVTSVPTHTYIPRHCRHQWNPHCRTLSVMVRRVRLRTVPVTSVPTHTYIPRHCRHQWNPHCRTLSVMVRRVRLRTVPVTSIPRHTHLRDTAGRNGTHTAGHLV